MMCFFAQLCAPCAETRPPAVVTSFWSQEVKRISDFVLTPFSSLVELCCYDTMVESLKFCKLPHENDKELYKDVCLIFVLHDRSYCCEV
jgi:hypothetical protein